MENLKALIYGRTLNNYQKALAISEFEKLIKRHQEANVFIKSIAEMLDINTDGVGFDEIQLTLDDFAEAISKLKKIK